MIQILFIKVVAYEEGCIRQLNKKYTLKFKYKSKRNIAKCYYFDENKECGCGCLFLITFWLFEIRNIKINPIEEYP